MTDYEAAVRAVFEATAHDAGCRGHPDYGEVCTCTREARIVAKLARMMADADGEAGGR
jgi:hypothetical protein